MKAGKITYKRVIVYMAFKNTNKKEDNMFFSASLTDSVASYNTINVET